MTKSRPTASTTEQKSKRPALVKSSRSDAVPDSAVRSELATGLDGETRFAVDQPVSETGSSRVPSRRMADEDAAARAPAVGRVQASGPSWSQVTRAVSQTAHDLRSPLSAIRQAAEMMSDETSRLSSGDRDLLGAMVQQCDVIDQLVGELTQLNRQSLGVPRVNRRTTTVAEIIRQIDGTLAPWTMPRSIDLAMQIEVAEDLEIFADPKIVRRLIVNLIINAINVTPDGERVILRIYREDTDYASVRMTVIDHGRGMSASDLKDIANQFSTSVSDMTDVMNSKTHQSAGEGLGMHIARQLAAASLSDLILESREGAGTRAGVSLPLAGSACVSDHWLKWRLRYLDSDSSTPSRDGHYFHRVAWRHPEAMPAHPTSVVVTGMTIGAAVGPGGLDAFEATLRHQMTLFDLPLMVDERNWLVCWDASSEMIEERVDRFDHALMSFDSSCRITHRLGIELDLQDRETSFSRLRDHFVHRCLKAANRPVHWLPDQVRPGTPPVNRSETPEHRLQAEMDRMRERIGEQSARMNQQSRRLRRRSN
ncbi:MAG: HAMP domain-containing sensor histidine kinase [Planctomycetota bacterium]